MTVAAVYSGYYKNALGQLVEDGSPICRSCKKKVVARGGNTSNLYDHHPQLFSECKVNVKLRCMMYVYVEFSLCNLRDILTPSSGLVSLSMVNFILGCRCHRVFFSNLSLFAMELRGKH